VVLQHHPHRGKPGGEHQREAFGAAPYDDFLDAWDPNEFDADEFLALVKSTGARYFVPTTKHHDGVTLWDAPGTDGRNTVARGPRRDLVAEFERATRNAGCASASTTPAASMALHRAAADHERQRRVRAPDRCRLREYAYRHVDDLVERYRPTSSGATSSGRTQASPRPVSR